MNSLLTYIGNKLILYGVRVLKLTHQTPVLTEFSGPIGPTFCGNSHLWLHMIRIAACLKKPEHMRLAATIYKVGHPQCKK